MASSTDPYKLSRPTVYLGLMLVFLILSAFVVLILSPQISTAFMANPGLNGLILGVLGIGTLLTFWQVLRLRPEIRWVNQYRIGEKGLALQEAPRLLSPMASLLRDRNTETILTPQTTRSILDSIGMRLDEAREITRYIIGLLVFLGLLGTFWGLTQTVSAVSQTIDSLDVSAGEIGTIFENLKTGLAAPLGGMGTAFSSSLFGLAGSLVLGFLDLQAGQAQNRFYTELEDWMSTITDIEVTDKGHDTVTTAVTAIDKAAQRLANSVEGGGGKEGATALANLAEGVQSLVQHMRSEQQMIREWVEAQAEQQDKLANVLDRLTSAIDAEDTEAK
jgi:hypothetical protein